MAIIPQPPLGLKPRKFHNEARLREVQAAISRYLNHFIPIPFEWIDEYHHLIEKLSEDAEKSNGNAT